MPKNRRVDVSALMPYTKPRQRKHIRTGDITEKIAASVIFNTELVNQINVDQSRDIQERGLNMLAAYFGAYVDNVARSNHAKYHHLYEPGYSGQQQYRLFEAWITQGSKPELTYNFTPSSEPGDSGYVFRNRAYVMENQIPMRISAKNKKFLRFEYKGKFYSKKQVYVAHPGGKEAGGSFAELFYLFMTNQGTKALQDLKFFERIEKGIANESRIALSRISRGKIEGMAANSAISASKIIKGLK